MIGTDEESSARAAGALSARTACREGWAESRGVRLRLRLRVGVRLSVRVRVWARGDGGDGGDGEKECHAHNKNVKYLSQ